jgi:hypothetical protein
LWAVELEPIGVRERFGIAVRGGEYHQYGVAGPDSLLTERDVLKRLAPDELVRGHQPH